MRADVYACSPSVSSDATLVSPLNNGGQVPTVSHTVFCVVQAPPPPPPSGRDVPPPPPSAPASTPPSVPPSDAPSGSVGGETSTPSDGGVEGETDVPNAPSTDIGGNISGPGSSLPLLLIVLGIIGLAAVVLTPARNRRR